MRSKYPALQKGVKNWPKQREPEEMVNIKIKSCWIRAVKYEHGATGDNDFHLVLSSSPPPPAPTPLKSHCDQLTAGTIIEVAAGQMVITNDRFA